MTALSLRPSPSVLLGLCAAFILAMAGVLWGPAVLSLRRPASGLTAADIGSVGVQPPAGARAPLGLGFATTAGRRLSLATALDGKPAVLVFADYGCRSLCGPALTLTRVGLEHTGLKPGRDFVLAVAGLNPRTTRDQARAMMDGALGAGPLRAATVALQGDAASSPALARALGYHYRWDAAHGQFAHPVAAFVLAPDGRLVRALSEIGLKGRDLRLALTAAAGGRIGGALGLIKAHCYGFDPLIGAYDTGVAAGVKLASAGLLAAVLMILAIGRRRPRPRAGA